MKISLPKSTASLTARNLLMTALENKKEKVENPCAKLWAQFEEQL